MTFDDITGDGRLWAVKYVGETENELYKLFDQWNDVIWLRSFLEDTLKVLSVYCKRTDINQAITDTIEDSEYLQCLI